MIGRKGLLWRSGFTLVELLVVITIISILTIITVSQFQTAKRRANDVARKSDLNSLNKALLLYFTDYNKFPAEDKVEFGKELKDDAGYSYMKVVPEEKNSSLPPFCYVVAPDQKSFALFSMLEVGSDSDCKWTANGTTPLYQGKCGNNYCFTIVSPNIAPGEL